jgi:hypothetical protein
MNARAYEIVSELRAILATLPGASAINFHASGTWTLLVITVNRDRAVSKLGHVLGLSTRGIGENLSHWWHRVTAEDAAGELRVVVVGPRHWNPPPDDVERTS